KTAKAVTGTRIRYWADRQIFNKTTRFVLDDLLERARQTAFLVPGLTLRVIDQRTADGESYSFRFDGGTSDFVDFVATDTAITDTWVITGSGSYNETVPVLQPNGHLVSQDVERTCQVG